MGSPNYKFYMGHSFGCFLQIDVLVSIPRTAIRFGRMPQSEKLRLKAEILTGEREVEDPQLADQKTLAKQIHEAYLKNFNMNKSKARTILTGKTSTPVRSSSHVLHVLELMCVIFWVFFLSIFNALVTTKQCPSNNPE